jgi:prephenate dehydratase
MEDINCLLSHPAILDHCEDFICDMERKIGMIIDRQATWDSAGACQIVKHEAVKNVAAIASEKAASAHGLRVMEKGVGNELNNETRYMILGRMDAKPLPLGLHSSTIVTKKSSIVIAVPNEAQALFKIVAAFALRNLMIIKIESRPAATAGGLFTSETHHWYGFQRCYCCGSLLGRTSLIGMPC